MVVLGKVAGSSKSSIKDENPPLFFSPSLADIKIWGRGVCVR